MAALWRVGPNPSCAPRHVPRSRRARGFPDRCDHRYAERQGHGKRGRHKDPIGYDAGKKIKGIKRNLIVDTLGLMLGISVIPASMQDRDCAANLIRRTRRLFAFIAHIFADGGYAGDRLAGDLADQSVTLEIVKRTDNEPGFKLVRRRWVVERTFSWLRRNRRLMAHYEALAVIAEGFAKLAMINLMLKRLTETKPTSPT
jgi:transposase